jgi:hypothetical protein
LTGSSNCCARAHDHFSCLLVTSGLVRWAGRNLARHRPPARGVHR